MKVAARIISGYVILIAILAALSLYQTIVLSKMRALAGEGGESGLRAAQAALEIIRLADRLDEERRRGTGQAPGTQEVPGRDTVSLIENRLDELSGTAGPDKLRTEGARLQAIWRELPAPGAATPEAAGEGLQRLRTQALTAYEIALDQARAGYQASYDEARRTIYATWFAAGTALVLGLFAALLVVRSIAGPLGQLTEGTRAIVAGKSFYRLDTSRSDELGQIAKDINTLSDRLDPRNGARNKADGRG